MRSGLTTLLLLVPILTVPLLAIFGIPQFAPVVASPFGEPRQRHDNRVGDSAAQSLDDLLAPLEDSAGGNVQLADARLNFSRDPAAPPQSRRPVAWPGNGRGQPPRLESTTPVRASAPADAPAFEQATDVEMDEAAVESSTAWPGDARMAAFVEETEAAQEGPPSYRRRPGTRSQSSELTRPRMLPKAATESHALTWQGAVTRLNQLEIRSFRLEPGREPNQFLFLCSYTPPGNPQVSYRFEAEANEPLKAVEKVLAQVEARRARMNGSENQ